MAFAHNSMPTRAATPRCALRRASVALLAAATPALLVAPAASAQGSVIDGIDVPPFQTQQFQAPQLPQLPPIPQLPQLPQIPDIATLQSQVVQAILNAVAGMPSIPGIGSPEAIAAGSLQGAGLPVNDVAGPSQTDPAAMSREVFDATNAYRQRVGVRTLVWDQHAADVATAHAQYLSRVGGVAHNQGALNEGMGENIAASSDPCNAACFVTLWDNSPGHQVNLRDPEYRGLGVGVAVNNGRVWVVQDFTY